MRKACASGHSKDSRHDDTNRLCSDTGGWTCLCVYRVLCVRIELVRIDNVESGRLMGQHTILCKCICNVYVYT